MSQQGVRVCGVSESTGCLGVGCVVADAGFSRV